MTTVRQVLDQKGHNVWTIQAEDSVLHALQMMADKEIGTVAVMEGERFVGMFSERHYARNVFLKGRSSPTTQLRDVMRTDVTCVDPDATVEECMAIMTENRVRYLPVLENDTLVGIVSIGDMVKSIIDNQEVTIKQLVNYISGA
jgi:CBS domain-containing protein